ncbi:unnamed protein product [Thelazia callipaeda]|uniref:CDI domain-containing protein n=1 Tax=Thelazia callipaeda TaxID=103827 RepID=A0A0N5D8D2_THECL|nr:unnamed protein product [Thelazia callipaeda]
MDSSGIIPAVVIADTATTTTASTTTNDDTTNNDTTTTEETAVALAASTTGNNSAEEPLAKFTKCSARRCLFGRPDPKNIDGWLKEELGKIQREQQLKWGFSFKTESIIERSMKSNWVLIPVPADSVPEFYRSSYYHSSSPCTACELENCIPCCSNSIRDECNGENTTSALIVSSQHCSDTELPVLPIVNNASVPKCKQHVTKKQTKLTGWFLKLLVIAKNYYE